MDKCLTRVYGGSFHGHLCGKNGKVVRDGVVYCGTHDPVAVKAKRDKRHAEWDAEFKEKQAGWKETEKRNSAIAKLCGHIPTDELENYELVTRHSSSTQGRK